MIAKGKDGKYTKFLARKGVIMATGDYQNNKAMSDYFIPDLKYMGRKQMGKTGDGFIMTYWAGGVIEPIGHTKMLHDFDAGPPLMGDMPFLAVNRAGKRFVNETVEMSLMNNYLRSEQDSGHYNQIFDADLHDDVGQMAGPADSAGGPEELDAGRSRTEVGRVRLPGQHARGQHAGRTRQETGNPRPRGLRGERQALQRDRRLRPGHRFRQAEGIPDAGREGAVLRHPPARAHLGALLRHADRRQPPRP